MTSTIALIERLDKEADNMQFNEDLDSMDDGIALMREAAAALSVLERSREDWKQLIDQCLRERDIAATELTTLLQRCEKAEAVLADAQKSNSKIMASGGCHPDDWWDDLVSAQQKIAAVIREAKP